MHWEGACLQRIHEGPHQRKRQLCTHAKPGETSTKVRDNTKQVKPFLLHNSSPSDFEGQKWPGELGKEKGALLWKEKKRK